MLKIIKKWGNSYVVVLSPDDMRAYDLKEGQKVEIKKVVEGKNGK